MYSGTRSTHPNTTIKPAHHIFTIGLTGGIGCGKSTVVEEFARLGVPVIDADRISRELVEPPGPALEAVVSAFGTECLATDGSLDRNRLRTLIFADPAARKRLEAILHPLIRREMEARRVRIGAGYCIMVIPLLFETGQEDMVDRILVVDCEPETQIERVVARDGLSQPEIRAIMAAQWDRDRRLAGADDVIVNNDSPAHLGPEVERLHQRYLDLAEIHGN